MVSTTTKVRKEKAKKEPGKTKTADVYESLKRDIVAGVWLPGTKLPIGDLREVYDVSLSPMREALSRLAAVGFVVAEGQRGFTVAPMSEDHLIDTNRMRTTLECMAIRESIESGDTNWEANMIAAFHRLTSTPYVDESNPGTTSETWTTYHNEFHDSLVSACGSFWLLRFRETLSDEMERFRNLSYGFTARKQGYAKATSKKDADPFENDHKRILDAALARDADKACKLIEKHFNKTVEIVLAEKSAFAEGSLS